MLVTVCTYFEAEEKGASPNEAPFLRVVCIDKLATTSAMRRKEK